MPRATVTYDAVRYQLESLPDPTDPGWVELKRLPYGKVLERRDMAAKMAVGGLGGKATELSATVESIQSKVTAYEFKNCIVDHNLEDDTGRKLNLGDERDIQLLDPRVGAEISQLIDKLNDWDSDLRGKEEQTSDTESEVR